MNRLAIVLFALAAATTAEDDRPVRRAGPELQPRINAAIGKGVEYLKSIQEADGSWPYGDGGAARDATAGLTALTLYALAASEVPRNDDSIRKGLRWTEKNRHSYEGSAVYSTYSASLLVLALTRIDPAAHRTRIHRLAESIVDGQLDSDLWTYALGWGRTKDPRPAVRRGGDNSNSQFAILALWAAAALAEYPVPTRTWQRVHRFYTRTQLRNGEWGYTPDQPGRDSMTAAGLCAYVYATAGLLGGATALPAAREDPIAQRGLKAFLRALPDARLSNYYLVYAIERTGTVLAIPEERWYFDGAKWLVDRQREGGSWGVGSRDAGSAYETSLALLFLSKATRAAVTPGGEIDRKRLRAAFLARVGPKQLPKAFECYVLAPTRERRTLAPRFGEAGAEAVGFLVGKLRSPEIGTRAAAYELLGRILERPILFEPGANLDQRDIMLAPIETFWKEEGARLRWDAAKARFVTD